MSPLALVTQADLAEERAALAREAPPPPVYPPHPLELQASAAEVQAYALRRLAAATRELAAARLEAAQAGVAQWCVDCDSPMPASRTSDRCPHCLRNHSKARWARESRSTTTTTPKE